MSGAVRRKGKRESLVSVEKKGRGNASRHWNLTLRGKWGVVFISVKYVYLLRFGNSGAGSSLRETETSCEANRDDTDSGG